MRKLRHDRNARHRWLLPISLVLAGVPAASAHAAEATRVATSFEEDNRFDVHFGIAYNYNFKRAAVLREWNSGSATDNTNRLVKDLMYRQQRHLITPTLEIGLWHDLAIYVAMPVVLADQRDYSFDQRADDCVFGDEAPMTATCTNKDNSTTIRDGIIPRDGFDATTTAAPFSKFAGDGTEMIFKGPVRRGLDQIHVGIKYGILNQTKRSHMPNWVIGAEGRFAVGKPMTFSRDIQEDEPQGNLRVGRGIHELGLWTALSRRHLFLDPFFTAYWRQAIRASNTKFEDFSDLGAQGRKNPQSIVGLSVGTEIVPFERKAANVKVSILLEGSAALHYGGRGYSEVWELLADSPAMVGSNDPTNAPNCNRTQAMDFAADNPGDPNYITDGNNQCDRFNGITDIQDYGTFGFTGGMNFHLGKYVRLQLGANLFTDTRHFVTFANRGDAAGGNDDDLVEPDTREVNPLRRDVVDNVGRRYAVDDVIDVYAYLRVWLTF